MKKLILPLLFLVVPSFSFSQVSMGVQYTPTLATVSQTESTAGFNLSHGIAFDFTAYVAPKLSAGLRFNAALLWSESFQDWDIPDVGRTGVEFESSVFSLMGFVRYQPLGKGKFSPYIDLLYGRTFTYTGGFYNVTEMYNGDPCPHEESFTSYKDNSESYGFSIGVEMGVADEAVLDISFTSVQAGTMDYLARDAIEWNDEMDNYEITESDGQFSYISFNVGVRMPLFRYSGKRSR